ncbi:D-alanyl-D-alanine carboxypeptidase family protein [Streptomyces sp. NBC_00448]|uniref:D-alanyl-D-alanine carboxypeptidase family protein n=1 Tax=Streptomyces sp. NBC_00448 TaxID=2903652 RepID=UPI002E1DD692
MAGDAPGREQQHETSGEPGIRPATDPRLAVFRVPMEAPEARVTEGGPEEQTAGDAVDAPLSHAQDDIEDPSSEPRSHPSDDASAEPSDPSSGRSRAGAAATSDDVVTVDAVTDSAPPAAPPAPRSAQEESGKTEPNRDQTGEAEEVTGAGGASGSDESGAGGAEDAGEDAGREANESSAEEEDGAPVAAAAEDAEAADEPDEDGADTDSATATANTDSAADADNGATTDDSTATDDGADADADADSDSASRSASVAGTGAEGSRAADARAGEIPSAGADIKDARPADAPAPPERPGPTVKPLVSDIPAEWPEEPQNGRQAPSSGSSVAFGAPGRPTRAETAPPRPAPLPPAQPPAAPAKSASGPAAPSTPPAPSAPPAPGGAEEAGKEAAGPGSTRSMPVPPPPDKQPLKLLAELTNTPPPPDTALRTVARRFKIWTPLVVLLAIVFVVVQALRPLPSPHLSLTAARTYTFVGTPLPQTMPWPKEGQAVAEVEGLGSLGVHGTQSPVPIASLTKVMTAYVILHDHPLTGSQGGPTIEVDAQAAKEAGSDDQSTAPVREGQRFDERRMLQLLLVPSGNNIARLLARWDSGTQDAFVAKMTKAAAQLGMTHTTYTGASGIEETTVSTAVDQLKLAREVMKNDVFRSVVAMPNVDIPGVGRIYNNNNDLVKVGVVGIKTGSSTPAGGALMWAAHKTVDGKQQLVLGVVLQQHGGTTVDDSLQTALARSQALIESVQGGLGSSTIVKKGTVVGKVDDGLGGSTPVVTSKDLTAIGWAGMKQDLTLAADGDGVPHHAAAGTQVGTLSFGNGSARTSVPVVLQSDLDAPGFGAKLTRF